MKIINSWSFTVQMMKAVGGKEENKHWDGRFALFREMCMDVDNNVSSVAEQ